MIDDRPLCYITEKTGRTFVTTRWLADLLLSLGQVDKTEMPNRYITTDTFRVESSE